MTDDRQTYEITARFGSVELGRPTGAWEQRGEWWYPVYTDTIRRDENGREWKREPTLAHVGISPAPWEIDRPRRRRSLWRRWLGFDALLPEGRDET